MHCEDHVPVSADPAPIAAVTLLTTTTRGSQSSPEHAFIALRKLAGASQACHAAEKLHPVSKKGMAFTRWVKALSTREAARGNADQDPFRHHEMINGLLTTTFGKIQVILVIVTTTPT